MVAIFLEHSNAAGSEAFIEIAIQGDCSTFFLPDDPSQEKISLSSHADDRHSYLCLEVHATLALLRTFSVSSGPCPVLGDDHRRSSFQTPSGRWAVHWDDDGKISQSMKPPRLPILSDTAGSEEEYAGAMEGASDAGRGSPSRSSRVTCSPTPSAAGGGEDGESAAESDAEHKVHDNEPAISGPLLGQTGTEELIPHPETNRSEHSNPSRKPKSTDVSNSASDLARPVRPRLRPASKDVAVALTADGPAMHPAHRADSSSSANAIETPSNSEDSADEPRTEGDADTPIDSGGTRGRKRKLKDMEVTGTTLHFSETETDTSKGVELAVSTIVSRNPVRSNATKDLMNPTKTPAKQTGNRKSPTLRDERRDSDLSQPSTGQPVGRQEGSTPAWYAGPSPVVLFSGSTTVQDERAAMSAFGRLGGKVGMTINDATVLCIPEGSVKKTGKLIMAVAKGIDIVTENWMADSQRLGRLPDVAHYLPCDEPQERAWGCNLREAIQRGKKGLTHLLSGTTVYLTKELRKGLGKLEREISQIAWILGAEAVKRRLPAFKDKDKLSQTGVLVIGVRDDPHGAHVGRLGQVLFNKDILTMAALRGRLQRDSNEFVIQLPVKDEEEQL